MPQTKYVARPTAPGIIPLSVFGSSLTDVGAVRTSNEDSIRVVLPQELPRLRSKGVLAVIADGMGGHEGGEVASSMATTRVGDCYYQEPGDPQQSLLRAFETANHEIYQHARKHSKLTGMGTTCTAVAVVNGMAYSAHVGDSRVYLVRDDQIYCMTEDHSAPMELVKQGMLTLAEARTHEEQRGDEHAADECSPSSLGHWVGVLRTGRATCVVSRSAPYRVRLRKPAIAVCWCMDVR